MGIFGSMLHGFLPFSLASWHGLNHAHSGMDGKATPAHDLNHVPCISFAGGQELFNNFFRICLSFVCCRIQQLTKLVRDLSAFIRCLLKEFTAEGRRGHIANPFCGGGMDIFWNHTIGKSDQNPHRQ